MCLLNLYKKQFKTDFIFPQEDLMRERETRRLRYGYEIDFPEYKPPFQKNVETRVTELEKQEES